MGNLTANAYSRLPLAEISVPGATAVPGAAFTDVQESVVVSYTSLMPYGGPAALPT